MYNGIEWYTWTKLLFEGDYTKRFFDEEDINNYFKIIGNVEFFETSMIRNEEEYSKPKVLYQVKVTKGED